MRSLPAPGERIGGRRAHLDLDVVDAEREGADRDAPLAVLDDAALAVDAQAERALGAVHEVRRVAGRVEADEVAREEAAQDLAVPGEDAERVVRRERDVEEVRDARVRPRAAERARRAHQLVVVDPDQRAGLTSSAARSAKRSFTAS